MIECMLVAPSSGSGKTAVAFGAIYMCCRAGYQAALMALGTVLDVPPLTVTGTQDAQSEAATRWLQERACLPVNGVVDRRTWDAASRLYPAVLGDGSTG